MNKFSILHISDIHKIEDVTYLSLLNSIKKDMANWEHEGIRKPSFIVISGDLIQGADTDEKIAAQYQEVTWLLEELTKRRFPRSCLNGLMKSLAGKVKRKFLSRPLATRK